MDVGYNRFVKPTLGKGIYSNRRPDVLFRTKDGRLHAREIPSKSDKNPILESRNDEAMRKLPEQMRGTVEVVPIKITPPKTGGQ